MGDCWSRARNVSGRQVGIVGFQWSVSIAAPDWGHGWGRGVEGGCIYEYELIELRGHVLHLCRWKAFKCQPHLNVQGCSLKTALSVIFFFLPRNGSLSLANLGLATTLFVFITTKAFNFLMRYFELATH